MKSKFYLLLAIALMLNSLASAQNLFSYYYSINDNFLNTALSAKYDYYQIGMLGAYGLEKLSAGMWAQGYINNNLGFFSAYEYNSFGGYAHGMDLIAGGFWKKDLIKIQKSIALGANLSLTRYVYSTQYITQVAYFAPSVSFFSENYSIGLSLENIPVTKDSLLQMPMLATIYGDIIISNLIKTYSINPSLYIGLGKYPFLAYNINAILSKVLILGLGQNFQFFSGMVYSPAWLQTGLKIKQKYYIYFRAAAFIYLTGGFGIYFSDALIALKMNIYRKPDAVPRYF